MTDPFPSVNGLQYKVRPADRSIDATYKFYVKLTADGGSSLYSRLYTMHYGCSQQGLIKTESPDFIP